MNTSSGISLRDLAPAALFFILGALLQNPLLLLAAFWPAQLRILRSRQTPKEGEPRGWGLPAFPLFMLALLFLAAFLCKPRLSDDYHRYLWEGHVQNHGYSPYSHAPASLYPVLEHPSEGAVNHDSLTAIYPPLAQVLFRIADLFSKSVYAWKSLILLALGLLIWLEPRARLPIFLFSPLVIVEGVWNAHLDVLALLPGFLLVRALRRRASLSAGAALAALVGLKLVPIVLAPICLLHFRGLERLRFAFSLMGALLLFYLPYWGEGAALFDSFFRFSREWYFNNPFFHPLKFGFGAEPARMVLGATLLAGLAIITLRPAPVEHKCALAWIAILLLSPTLYPWYLLWLLPFLPNGQWKYLHLGYMATCLSYFVVLEYQWTGVWRERPLWMVPEWVILLYCFFRLMRPPVPTPKPMASSG